MGFTLRCILGLVLVLHFSSVDSVSTWERYIREAILTEAPRSSSEKSLTQERKNTINTTLTVEPVIDDNKPKTEKTTVNKVYNRNDIFTTEGSRLRSKINTDPLLHDNGHLESEKEKSQKEENDHHFASETTDGFPPRSEKSIDFDIKKFTPEYKNKNDVFGRSLPPEAKFASQDFGDKFTYKEPDFSYFDSTTEYRIPHYSFFDEHDDDFHKNDDIPHFNEEPELSETKDSTSFDIHLEQDKNDSDTRLNMDFLKLKRFEDKFEPLPKKDKNSTRKNIVTEKRTKINYNSSFNKTEIIGDKAGDEEDDFEYTPKSRITNYESTTHKNIIYSTTLKKNSSVSSDESAEDDDEDDDDFFEIPSPTVRIIEPTTHRTIVYHPTTRKNTVLTKPPALNNSHVSLLNNKIESDTIKNIDSTTVRELTTRRPTRRPIRLPTTRRSNFSRLASTIRSTTTAESFTSQPAITVQETTTTAKPTTTTQGSPATQPMPTTQLPTSTMKPVGVIGLDVTAKTIKSTSSGASSSIETSSSTNERTVSPLTVKGVIPISSTIKNNLEPDDLKDTFPLTSITHDSIVTTGKSTTSSTKDESSSSTISSVPISENHSTTDASVSSSTKQVIVSSTISEPPQSKGEKETISYAPTRNTVINISKRGSVKFNSPTTEINRLRNSSTIKSLDTTSVRPTGKFFRSTVRSRPSDSISVENQNVDINPVFSESVVASATSSEISTEAIIAESSSTNTTTEKVTLGQSTTENVNSTVSVKNPAQVVTTPRERKETSPDTSTSKIPNYTIPQSTLRRRMSFKTAVPKIITPRYATTSTTTTTVANVAEKTDDAGVTTEYFLEKQNVTDATLEKTSTTQNIDTKTIIVKDMNYTIKDDLETSTKYSTEIETVMNNSFVVTSSTTERYSYEVSEETEDFPETSTAPSVLTSINSELAPKITEKTTTLSEDYDEEEGGEEDDKLPNPAEESEHSTHGQEPKSVDDDSNKEKKEKTDNDEDEKTEKDEYTESPYYSETEVVIETTTNFELLGPKEGNGGKIAAIVISCVGAICLIILAALLILVRKRQKSFSYGQRCTPVSLDAYSMDNVSVYNSVRRKGIIRASKRSYGNPAFEDPDSISHPLNFPALAKFATNSEDIKAEFEEIPQVTARTSELPDGCDVKNRYANVIPLPETRVFLTPIDGVPNSDYINANYVTGPKDTKGYYIACQAPLQNTIEDFWRMIWEQQTKLILMITHLFENGTEKCADYMPPSEITDCHRVFGDFQITLKKREVKDKYIISSLQLKNMVSNSWREVTHFWYLGWPEKGVPLETNSLIAFLIEARSYVKNTAEDNPVKNQPNRNDENSAVSPIVVHCSPGTGRTGTIIACDIAIREFELSRLVDIPKIVYKIRRDRASSVQTKDQYAFIYKVISVYATKLTGGSFDSL